MHFFLRLTSNLRVNYDHKNSIQKFMIMKIYFLKNVSKMKPIRTNKKIISIKNSFKFILGFTPFISYLIKYVCLKLFKLFFDGIIYQVKKSPYLKGLNLYI